jgi:hypothetical protein
MVAQDRIDHHMAMDLEERLLTAFATPKERALIREQIVMAYAFENRIHTPDQLRVRWYQQCLRSK